jgi:hypothetical protein
MTKILVEVRGGCVQRVVSTSPAEVVILDWDGIKAGDTRELQWGPVDEVVSVQDIDAAAAGTNEEQ